MRDALDAEGTALTTVRDRLGYRLLEDVGAINDIHLRADRPSSFSSRSAADFIGERYDADVFFVPMKRPASISATP